MCYLFGVITLIISESFQPTYNSSWCYQIICLCSSPIWGRFPFWLSVLNWVGSTTTYKLVLGAHDLKTSTVPDFQPRIPKLPKTVPRLERFQHLLPIQDEPWKKGPERLFVGDVLGMENYPLMWGLFHKPLDIRIPALNNQYQWKARGFFSWFFPIWGVSFLRNLGLVCVRYRKPEVTPCVFFKCFCSLIFEFSSLHVWVDWWVGDPQKKPARLKTKNEIVRTCILPTSPNMVMFKMNMLKCVSYCSWRQFQWP